MKTAVEMQFIAQAGLAYSKDPYDIERFGRLRELAAEMLARGSGLPMRTVRDVFLCETGYQTPKSTRGPPSSRKAAYCWCRKTPACGRCPAAGWT